MAEKHTVAAGSGLAVIGADRHQREPDQTDGMALRPRVAVRASR